MSNDPILKLEDVSCTFDKHTIFSGVNLKVNTGDVIVMTGRSGGGKSTLLKCIAHMTVYKGEIKFGGKNPTSYGIPNYRTKVLYSPQRPSLLPGTPRTFLKQIRTYSSRNKEEDNEQAAIELGEAWSLEEDVWDRPWSQLSGGEAQRAALAIACTLKSTEILLLDEPTSALDASTAKIVETHIASLPGSSDSHIEAVFWITHSEDQLKKGTRLLRVEGGHVEEDQVPGDV